MWDKLTIYDSQTNSVMEFGLVNLADDSDMSGLSAEPQAQEPTGQDPDEPKRKIIGGFLAKYLPAHVTDRQPVIESVRTWPDWVKVELSKEFGCAVNEVPAAVADWMGWTAEKAETSQSESSG